MKEFLSNHKIEFKSVNILEDVEGKKELTRLGVTSVPVLSRGDDYVHGLVLSEIANFVGVNLDNARLSPNQLADRIGLVLTTAQRLIRQLPQSSLKQNIPNRNRSLKELSHHILKISDAFLDTMQGAKLILASLNAPPTDFMKTPEDIAHFGEEVHHRFQKWSEQIEGISFEDKVETYYGEQDLHEVLERTCWHSAQHLRQLALMLDTLGIEPDRPLTEKDLEGLPLPKEVWG